MTLRKQPTICAQTLTHDRAERPTTRARRTHSTLHRAHRIAQWKIVRGLVTLFLTHQTEHPGESPMINDL